MLSEFVARRFLVVTLYAVVLYSCAAQGFMATPPESIPVVKLALGRVIGIEQDGVEAYFGLPYALPPIGNLRFSAPQPISSWTGTRDGRVLPPPCPQVRTFDVGGQPSVNEDCLYLNIWRPATQQNATLLPVLVWIHGGGLRTGWSGSPRYDASRLVARTGLIVITLNYRLGALGLLAAGKQSGQPATPSIEGNFALQDLVMALQWIQANIESFGGDPQEITIAGESAGAGLVFALMASPPAAGLFQRAIAQSPSDSVQPRIYAKWEDDFNYRIIDALGCSGSKEPLACLRRLPVEKVLTSTVGGNDRLTLSLDSKWLPLDPYEAMRQGKVHKVPVVIGSNLREYDLGTSRLEMNLGHTMTEDDFTDRVHQEFGTAAKAVLKQYPAQNYPTPAHAYSDVLTARRYACMANSARRNLARFVSVWGYELVEYDPVQQEFLAPETSLLNSAYHSTDLAYLFNTDHEWNRLEGRAASLSQRIQDFWGEFVRAQTPNGKSDSPIWPIFSREHPELLGIATQMRTVRDFHIRHFCDFWESTGLVPNSET